MSSSHVGRKETKTPNKRQDSGPNVAEPTMSLANAEWRTGFTAVTAGGVIRKPYMTSGVHLHSVRVHGHHHRSYQVAVHFNPDWRKFCFLPDRQSMGGRTKRQNCHLCSARWWKPSNIRQTQHRRQVTMAARWHRRTRSLALGNTTRTKLYECRHLRVKMQGCSRITLLSKRSKCLGCAP